MKLKPDRKRMVQAMDDLRIYLIYLVSCMALAVGGLVVFVFLSRTFAFLVILAVGVTYGYLAMTQMQMARRKITDITDNFLEFDGKDFYCHQTSGDRYESCSIDKDEIIYLTADTRPGHCGFLMMIRPDNDSRDSVIQTNGKIVDEDLFEVHGELYETDRFTELFHRMVAVLPEGAHGPVQDRYKNWYSGIQKQKIPMFVLPWLLAAGVAVVQYVYMAVLG